MNPKKTTKSFDCVAWKHKRQAEIYSDIKGMTPEQEIQYFEQGALSGPLGAWWRKVIQPRPKEITRGRRQKRI